MAADGEKAGPNSKGPSAPELSRKIQQGFEALMATVEGLDDRALAAVDPEGQWSIKDHLAHLAAWEAILLRFHIGGEPFESAVGMDGVRYRVTSYDVINDHLHSRYENLTASEVMRKLRLGHEAVMREVSRLTDAALAQPRPWLDTPDGPSGPLSQYIAWNTYEHYAEHQATIESLTKARPSM